VILNDLNFNSQEELHLAFSYKKEKLFDRLLAIGANPMEKTSTKSCSLFEHILRSRDENKFYILKCLEYNFDPNTVSCPKMKH
jgi:hypothetical protein